MNFDIKIVLTTKKNVYIEIKNSATFKESKNFNLMEFINELGILENFYFKLLDLKWNYLKFINIHSKTKKQLEHWANLYLSEYQNK